MLLVLRCLYGRLDQIEPLEYLYVLVDYLGVVVPSIHEVEGADLRQSRRGHPERFCPRVQDLSTFLIL